MHERLTRDEALREWGLRLASRYGDCDTLKPVWEAISSMSANKHSGDQAKSSTRTAGDRAREWLLIGASMTVRSVLYHWDVIVG